jgi:hypothetical protein
VTRKRIELVCLQYFLRKVVKSSIFLGSFRKTLENVLFGAISRLLHRVSLVREIKYPQIFLEIRCLLLRGDFQLVSSSSLPFAEADERLKFIVRKISVP